MKNDILKLYRRPSQYARLFDLTNLVYCDVAFTK